jgi:hypothetical protein
MLSRRRCPHTGIVNFYADADPFLAVGSVIEAGGPGRFHWRCYVGGEPAAGSAPDLPSAELQLSTHFLASQRGTAERDAGRRGPGPQREDARFAGVSRARAARA